MNCIIRFLTKYSTFLLVITVTIFLLACADDDSPNGGAITGSQQTLYQVLNSDNRFDSLIALADNNLAIKSILENENSNLTLFAPSNEAFVKFESDLSNGEYSSDIDRNDLSAFFIYHIISSGRLSSDQLISGDFYLTEYNDSIQINLDGTLRTGSINKNIEILESLTSAQNGIIHLIDDILIPPSLINSNTTNANKTIAQLASETAGLDSLFAQLSYFPDLVAVLSDTNVNYTVFAPNNQAFINLLATPGFPNSFDAINPDIIKGMLTYHVVPGQKITSGELGPAMATLYNDPATGTNQTIMVNPDGTLLTGSANNSISIVTADIQASNGVLHIVESVLISPSFGATLSPILGTLAGTVLLGVDYTQLASLINVADSDVPTGQTSITSILADFSNSYTVFGVPDAVFTAGSVDPNSFAPNTARAILLDHIVGGFNLSSSFSNGQVLTTLGGNDITFSTASGLALISSNDTIPVIQPDITNNISNGVIHAIGGIILF